VPTIDPTSLLAEVEQSYRRYFEVAPVRASVTFLGVQPIEILRYGRGSAGPDALNDLVSLGMARNPMSGGTEATEVGPRAELLLSVRGAVDHVWRRLAVLAAAPVVEGVVYQAGGRIDLGEAWSPGSRCTGALLTESPIGTVTAAEPVQILTVVPACGTELAWARVHGTESLRQLWASAGVDTADLLRSPVALP